VKFVYNLEDCINHDYKGGYLTLSIIVISASWVFVCLRIAFGSRVLSWRGLFGHQQEVWEIHFQERIEHILRLLMCCLLNQPKYFFVSKSVRGRVPHPVALGVAKILDFRAYGTASILEFLRALDHIRRNDSQKVLEMHDKPIDKCVESNPLSDRSKNMLLEASSFVRFSTAAYTGVALDILRLLEFKNPFLVLRRQELFRVLFSRRNLSGVGDPPNSPPSAVDASYDNNRRSVVKGDNAWNGHGRAFARYAQIDVKDILGGRVGFDKRNVRPKGMSSVKGLLTYFVAQSPKQKTIIIAVRGTADLEDILVDVSAFEGLVTYEDIGLDAPKTKAGPGCGWAHFGVLEGTREVYTELMGDGASDNAGMLPRIMSDPKYAGWSLRVVGHSLGAATAALLTLRLRKHYPNIHAFCYNPWPVVEEGVVQTVGENTCRSLITQLCYNEDVVSRVTFPTVCQIHEKVCAEIIKIQQNPWRGQKCFWCCPDIRAVCAACNFGCTYFCYCLSHATDNLEATMDKHGRSTNAPNHVISTSQELRKHCMEAERQDKTWEGGIGRSMKAMMKSAWKPKAMKVDEDKQSIMPVHNAVALTAKKVRGDGPKSPKSPRKQGLKEGEELYFPLRSLNYHQFESRWKSLRAGQRGENVSTMSLSGSMDCPTPASNTDYSKSLRGVDDVSLQFSGMSWTLFGEILHLRSCRDAEGGETWYAAESTANQFKQLIVADGMFSDHMPWHLEAALHCISDRLLQTARRGSGSKHEPPS